MMRPAANHEKTSRQATRDDVKVHKQLLQGIFFSPDYQQILYNQFKHCQ